jgi:hypothetical protein
VLPLCFVLMPFGKKALPCGATIDFDSVYAHLIAPAVRKAGMEPLRADEEVSGGVIQKRMYEQLILCDFAVADLTDANANVFYELGLRHGIRPATTVLLFAGAERMPLDVAPLRAMPYELDSGGKPANAPAARDALHKLLESAKARQAEPAVDSPVFQLVEGYGAPDIARLKTDVFRDRAEYAVNARNKLETARRTGRDALYDAARSLGDVKDLESGVLIDLLLSYRAVEDWQSMVDLVAQMAKPLARSVMVREQLAFALHRVRRRDEAEQLLVDLINQRGPSSETNGLLGRIYKDRWKEARSASSAHVAAGWLKKAVDTYLQGFEVDWRDAYPGVNAVTLMEIQSPPDPRRLELAPVVTYSVKRRIAKGAPDYWDHATLVELAILRKDEGAAGQAIADALAAVRENWEPKSTADNLALIREARAERGEDEAWANEIEDVLRKRAGG